MTRVPRFGGWLGFGPGCGRSFFSAGLLLGAWAAVWWGLSAPAEGRAPQPPSGTEVVGDSDSGVGGSVSTPVKAWIPDQAPEKVDWARSLTGDRLTSLTDAELVALIRRSIQADSQYVEALTAELEAEGEGNPYKRAEDAFNAVDKRLQALRAALESAEGDAETPADRRERLREQIGELEPVRDLARERFDLAIERRRLVGLMIPLLKTRIAQGRDILERGFGESDRIPGVDVGVGGGAAGGEGSTPKADLVAAAKKEASGSVAEGVEARGNGEGGEAERPSRELARATGEAARWEAVVEQLQGYVDLAAARLATINRALELERALQDNARRTFDNAEALRGIYSERFQTRSLAQAPPEELEALRQSLRDAADLARETRARARAANDRVSLLTENRSHVLEELTTRKKDVELALVELDFARREVARISNPFHPRNLFRWFLDRGPRILGILVGMTALHFAAQILGARVVRALASRGIRGSKEERLSRANTLVNAFRQAASLAILVGGSLMILDEAGVPIGPLLGGAAVLGLAVAFGAQNLIKDFFQGFMILLENQYKLNDVVRIGSVSGMVERITLRTTVLRSLDGTLHFIPNGQIEAVGNMTHGWSRALFDLPVAYREDTDRVVRVVLDVCAKLRDDPDFGPLILEDATMLGVDDFADSAVIVKFFIKTIPLQQWAVRRELLRRLKKRFDAEGIEIPFPHRTVYHRAADGEGLERALAEAFARLAPGPRATDSFPSPRD